MAMATASYRHRFNNPAFLNSKGERMPNNGGWQDWHVSALRAPRAAEVPMVGLLTSWAQYADMHRDRYESGIGDDGVLGPEWETLGRAIRALLNGECGRLDCGTLDGFILDTLLAEGFKEE